MAASQEQQSQTADFIKDNIVKIVDKNGNFYGSGFFIEVDKQIFCITCHHCIYMLHEIFVERFGIRYSTKWIEAYSEMKQDLAVLKVENSQLKPLIYAKEAMANFAVTIRGFSGEKIKSLPEGTSGRDSFLSDTFTPFVAEEKDDKGNNKWNRKPAVYVNVYECEGKFDLGFSGSPVCYKGPNKVVGIFTAKDNNFGYVIPIQTLLDKFEENKLNAKQSSKISEPRPSDEIKSYLEQGNRYLEEKKYRSALDKFDSIIYDPNYTNAIFNKAYTLGELQENIEAIKWYEEFLTIIPGDVNALGNIGTAFSRLGGMEEAIKWYDTALAIQADDVDLLIKKTYALLILGRGQEALRVAHDALSLRPESPDALLNMGLSLNNLQRYDKAIDWYNKYLKILPNDATVLGNIALAFDGLGKYEEALEWYTKALAIDPNHVNNISLKALTLSRLGKTKEVMKYANMISGIDPKDAGVLGNVALALNIIGKSGEAIKWFDKALEIIPDHANNLRNKTSALDDLGRYEEQLEIFDKLLEINPKDLIILNDKGVTLSNLERYEEAMVAYDKALLIDPKYTLALNNKKIAIKKIKEKAPKKRNKSQK